MGQSCVDMITPYVVVVSAGEISYYILHMHTCTFIFFESLTRYNYLTWVSHTLGTFNIPGTTDVSGTTGASLSKWQGGGGRSI